MQKKPELAKPAFDREATNDDAVKKLYRAVIKLGRVRKAGGCDLRIQENTVVVLRAKMSPKAQNELNEGVKALNKRNRACTTPRKFNRAVWRSGIIK